ncbi:putative disease resistance protein RGA1 [Syzygium oleosum]|uniref:putative disease resistance protein RGA1 n=1 Tax=Syzygium oleosum TaxID=219896 RepID=UPI0024BB30D1|nr:putative disease resistance protein RGA1 [Syzygium oleosum]
MRHHQTIVSQQKHLLCSLLSNTSQPPLLPLEMAEAVLFSLATDILKSIAAEMAKPGGSFASQKIQLLCGAKDELESLKETVQTIQAVLLDAEKQEWHNNQVKLWLKRLKHVLYDVQDLLDDGATEDLRRKVTSGNKMLKEVRVFFSKSNQLAYHLKVANKIQELKKKLDRIKEDRKFHLEEYQSEETMAVRRGKKTVLFAPDSEIIGREGDKEMIKRLLFDSSSSQSLSVVSIVGIGGLGKTALARLVFNDVEVTKHFGLKMWVSLSEISDMDLIFKEVLKSAKDDRQGHDDEMEQLLHDLENKPIGQLPSLIQETLRRRKCLLVLDDLGNENRLEWSNFRDWLKSGVPGSKILVTTRNHSKAMVIDAKSVVHNLKGLSEDKAWDLFKKMAFGDGEESLDSKLEEIGRDIVKKCAGVPLAIKTMGSLLYAKKEKEWPKFKEHELSKIDKSEHGIMEVLKLSYDHLPSHLKHCFAYCALFPKHYVFDKQTMIQLWMAQGFIESLEGNEDLEETGDSYVSDLLSRSFLEFETVDDYTGEVKMFKMHDLMHDLALRVAGDECKIVNLNEGSINGGIRHASFASQSSSPQEVTSIFEPNNLRTFLSLKESRTFVQNGILSKFRHCRVLGLGYAHFGIPTSLGSRSKHLRFLDISENLSMESMPDSITDLVNLQTLKLCRCKSLKTLPRDLRKLINLRHLLIDGCDSLSHLPSLSEVPSLKTLNLMGLDALEFLQEISYPEHSNTTRPFFPSLERLSLLDCRNLKGWWGRRLERLSLLNCRNLKGWWGRRQMVGADQDRARYNPQSSFPKLLSAAILGCPHLNSVPLFPLIEYLNIASAELLEQVMAVLDCPSKAPVESTFIPLSKLKGLHFAGGDLEHSMLETLLPVLNNLQSMSLNDCTKLKSLSRGMQYLSSLQHLVIGACEELDLSSHDDEHGTQWRSLVKLRVLRFIQLPKLVTLPEGIQHVTTLQFLEIEFCDNLTSLPEWIGNFSSLEMLKIVGCKSLRRCPEGIVHLTNPEEKVRVIGNVPLADNFFLQLLTSVFRLDLLDDIPCGDAAYC